MGPPSEEASIFRGGRAKNAMTAAVADIAAKTAKAKL
jgi:hypothetical protein